MIMDGSLRLEHIGLDPNVTKVLRSYHIENTEQLEALIGITNPSAIEERLKVVESDPKLRIEKIGLNLKTYGRLNKLGVKTVGDLKSILPLLYQSTVIARISEKIVPMMGKATKSTAITA